MALEFLCSVMIENNRETAVHPEATHLKATRDKKTKQPKINFYRANPILTIEKRIKPVPKGTNTIITQNYEPHKHWINYGLVAFISHRGNILNSYKL